VKFLNITSSTLKTLPRGITKKFKNIASYYINCEKLEEISYEDLKEFGENLNFLSIAESSLSFITENLLEAATNLTYVYMRSQKDKMQNVHKNAFNPILNNIRTFGIIFPPCFEDDFGQNNQQARAIIEKLEFSCKKPNFEPNIKPRDCKDVDETDSLVYWIAGIIAFIILVLIVLIIIVKRLRSNRRGNFQMS
jgi:hypothetical protein